MTIGEKIKQLRLKLSLTQEELATAVHTTKQTIYKYEVGIISNIPVSKIKLLADKLQTTPADLMCWEETNEPYYENLKKKGLDPYTPKVRKIPVLGYVSAGLPIYADEHIIDYTYTEIDNDGYDYFALKVKGDSMSAARINDGDTVIVRVQQTADNGDIVVVLVDNEEATVKEFNHVGDVVQLIPHSFNSSHRIQEYKLEETQINIIGKVIKCEIKF